MKRLVLAAGLLCGCASSQEGTLFRNDIAAVSRFHITNAQATSSEAFAELSDGTTCVGRLSRTDATDNSVSPESPVDAKFDRGVAVLVCRSSVVLRCKLVHRIGVEYAYGECSDQHGAHYTVVF